MEKTANLGAQGRVSEARQGITATDAENRPDAHTRAILVRTENTPTHTLGELHVLGERFFVLELPYKNNLPNVSAIPLGIYIATYLPRSASGKYKRVYWIRNVPNRVGCLQHNGNLVRHSRGCQLLGLRAGTLSGERAVLNSRTALADYVELLGKRTIELDIRQD